MLVEVIDTSDTFTDPLPAMKKVIVAMGAGLEESASGRSVTAEVIVLLPLLPTKFGLRGCCWQALQLRVTIT